MKTYLELEQFDLLAVVEVIKPEMGGRSIPVFDGYRGQFFWPINNVNGTDWLASYVFEDGKIEPGEQGKCKVILGNYLRKIGNNNFPEGSQFAIREGIRIVAIGEIIENLNKGNIDQVIT